MRPDEGDLDEEIRGHLAISIQERIDRGEDPVSARRAALARFLSAWRAALAALPVRRVRWSLDVDPAGFG